MKYRSPALLTILVLVIVGSPGLLSQPTEVRFGVVWDGPSERNQQLLQIFREEISLLLDTEYSALFPADKQLVADWTAAGVRRSLDQLLGDSGVDMVLTLGILTSAEAGRRNSLNKPVLAPFASIPGRLGIPSQIREVTSPGEPERVLVSGVRNLSYLPLGIDYLRDVEAFREVVGFERLTVLVLAAWGELGIDLERLIRQDLAGIGINDVDLIPVGSSFDQALAAIPSNAEAVYITPLPAVGEADFRRLVEILKQRRLPSFSALGREQVSLGILMGLGPDDDASRRARRIGLNIQEILEGADAGTLSVSYIRQERLAINMATAQAIGISPRFTTLLEAELIDEIPDPTSRTLSLGSVVREASTANLDLAAADRNVAAGFERVGEAKSLLLPRLDFSGASTFVDGDRAEILPTLGARQFTTSLTTGQVIYSDGIWANYGIEKSLQTAREQAREQLRLDVILTASQGYLNVLRAKTILEIQKNNLELTQTNLALSRSRVNIGVAGRDEVFRWESQVADNQKAVIDADSLRRQAAIEVNRALNRDLAERFATSEVILNDPELSSSFEQLRPYNESPAALESFSTFLVQESFSQAPELRQLEAAIAAKNREVVATKRRFFLPDVTLFGDLTGANK